MSEGSSLLPQLVAAMGATLGAFALGNVICWASTGMPGIAADADFNDGTALKDVEKEQTVAIFMLGAALVPIFAAVAFPRIGKKWTLMSLSIPFVAGWVLLLVASNVPMLLIGRFLTGFSGGAFVMAAPAYITEIAETKYRGALSTLMQLMITLGILFINVNCNTDWRVVSGICIVFPGLLALWMFWMPRSPYFLVFKDDLEGAKKSLQFLRGKKARVDGELDQIKEEVAESKRIGSVSPMTIWKKPEYLKPMGISLVLMALQQLSGINYVLSYSLEIFESSGSTIDPCASAMMLGGIQVLFTFVTVTVIDRFGRKVLLIVSDLGICISMVGIAVFFKLKETCDDCDGAEVFASKTTVDDIGFLPLVSLMIFVGSFAIGFGPIPWVVNAEIFPSEAKGVAASICTSFNWLVSYAVSLLVPPIGRAINPSSCYFIFAAIALAGAIFVIIFVPETKGKSEVEIRALFSGKKTSNDTEMK